MIQIAGGCIYIYGSLQNAVYSFWGFVGYEETPIFGCVVGMSSSHGHSAIWQKVHPLAFHTGYLAVKALLRKKQQLVTQRTSSQYTFFATLQQPSSSWKMCSAFCLYNCVYIFVYMYIYILHIYIYYPTSIYLYYVKMSKEVISKSFTHTHTHTWTS